MPQDFTPPAPKDLIEPPKYQFAPPKPTELIQGYDLPPGIEPLRAPASVEAMTPEETASTAAVEKPDSLWQQVNTPFRKSFSAIIPEKVSKYLVGTAPLEIATELAEKAAPDATVTKVARGVTGGLTDLVDSFATPLGVATLGIGGLPKLAQRALSGIFAAQMLSQTPEAVRAFKDAIDKGDVANAVRSGIGLVGSVGMAGLAAHSAAVGHPLSAEQLQKIETDRNNFWQGVQQKGYQPPANADVVNEAVRNTFPEGTPGQPGEAKPFIDLRKPIATGNPNATQRVSISGDQHQRVSTRENLPANPPEVRLEEGKGTESGGGPVGTTPVAGPEPVKNQATIKSGDIEQGINRFLQENGLNVNTLDNDQRIVIHNAIRGAFSQFGIPPGSVHVLIGMDPFLPFLKAMGVFPRDWQPKQSEPGGFGSGLRRPTDEETAQKNQQLFQPADLLMIKEMLAQEQTKKDALSKEARRDDMLRKIASAQAIPLDHFKEVSAMHPELEAMVKQAGFTISKDGQWLIRGVPPIAFAQQQQDEKNKLSEPLNPGGAESALPPDKLAQSQANNSRAAFEALAKENGGTPLPETKPVEPVAKPMTETATELPAKVVEQVAPPEGVGGAKPSERALSLPAQSSNPFYSRLTRTVEQSPQGKATGQQWKAMIRNSKLGVNADEMGLVGVGDLEDGKTYTKQEVVDYLKANEIVVKDVTLGASDLKQRLNQEETDHQGGEPMFDVVDSSGRVRYTGGTDDSAQYIADDMKAGRVPAPTHFSTYQLPGAKEGSYREVLLTVPDFTGKKLPDGWKITKASKEDTGHSWQVADENGRTKALGDTPEEAQQIAIESYAVPKTIAWRDGHTQYSGTANPIVRMRFNERTTADGKRMLFLEEIQAPQKGEFSKMPALFQKNWREIAFKWALRHAAENGFDALGWTTGEMQVERYDLSKQVNAIQVNVRTDGDYNIEVQKPGNRGFIGIASGVKANQLESHIGKDLAKQVIDGSGEKSSFTFQGDDLTVGGEGLKKLYDSDFRNVVNNLPAVKKAGQKVGTTQITSSHGHQGARVVQTPEGAWRAEDMAGNPVGHYESFDVAIKHQVPITEPVHSLDITPAIRDSVMAGQPLFSLGESGGIRPTILETAVTGIENIRQLLTDPKVGWDARTRQVISAWLDTPVMRDLDWSGLEVELKNQLEGNAKGTRLGQLVQLAASATPDTFPHEMFHILYDLLPKDYKAVVEQSRQDYIQKLYPDAPPSVIDGTMGSETFRQSQLPIELYPYINASEFLATFAGRKFATDAFEARNRGTLATIASKVQAWITGMVNAFKRVIGTTPTMQRVFDELVAGTWKPTPETGEIFEKQLSLPRTPKEYDKQQTFEERATPERTLAAYGDIASLKAKAADTIEATARARSMVMLPNQELMAALASTDMAVPRLTFGNYDAMRVRTEGSDPGLRGSVIVDAWRGLGYEQRRAVALEAKLAQQEAVVKSPGFLKKVDLLMRRQLASDTADEVLQTYRHQIAQEAGNVMRELNERGKSEAQYDQLRSDLARLEKMPEFSEAVAQRVNNIIDTVMSTPEGIKLLFQGHDKTGQEIFKTYLDILGSTQAKPKAGIPVVDESLLSPADRARLEASRQPVLSNTEKAFAQLASSVLGANSDLRAKLATLAYFKENPEFQAQVTAVGEKFQKQFAKDPNNAIAQIVKTATKLKANELNAENAWLRLNKQIMPEIERYRDLQQAVAINRQVMASPEWKALVNQIHTDAGAIRIPDSELSEISKETVWNEFTGHQQLRSPSGATYEVNLGFTKTQAKAAQHQMQGYLADVASWLGDPKNQDSPDRAYWNMRYDFVDAALNTSTVLSPTATIPLGGIKGAWTMMEFVFKSANLPDAKLSFTASNNFQRAWAVADQWYNGVEGEWRTRLIQATKSHGMDANFEVKNYREEVMDRLASEYRNGKALKAGDRLNNGIVLTPQDMQAFRYQGQVINQLFSQMKNLGREKVMVDGVILDEWSKNVFGLRAPQELGAEPGTTLPHEFAGRARALATRVSQPGADLLKIYNEAHVFDEFVKRFVAERKADYSTVTPFEALYKEMAAKWRAGDTDAPRTVDDIVDYLNNHTTGDMTREQIQEAFVGEMTGQLRKFYKDFVEKEGMSDVRALRATKQSAFTTGFNRDVGSSFFYDYGAVTSPEIRSLAIDSTNFHLVRFVKSLDSLLTAYDQALAEYNSVTGIEAKAKFTKERMDAYKSGEDFRNYERMLAERSQVEYLKKNIGSAYGSQDVKTVDMFSNFGRVTGDMISGSLSGLMTLGKVYVGSVVKMGLVTGNINRFYMGAYVKGAVSTVLSTMRMGYGAARHLPGETVRAFKEGYNESFWTGLARGGEAFTEGLFRQGTFFNQQYQYGLGFKNPVGFRIYNILTNPYAHGRGFDPKLSSKALIRMPQKLLWRGLSLAEAPLEVVKAMFPQLAYSVSYDAAARAAGWTIDAIGSQARRSFEFLEKSGGINAYDLDHPSDLKNILPAEYVLPRGLFPKGQTNLNQARDWWQRGIDVPLNEMVINYWRKLSQTSKEQRGEVSFIASDAPPEKVQQIEDARTGALMAILLKDVHHASPENRPLQFRVDPMWRFLFPLMGWTAHSVRSTLQALGRSPVDKRGQVALMALSAMSLLGFTASTILLGEQEKGLKKVISEGVFGEEFPEKMIYEAQSPGEAAKLTAIDSVTWIPQLHNIVASLLGESSQQVSDTGLSMFSVEKAQSLLRYFKGVIATGDPTYGLPGLVKQLLPFGRFFVNQLDSQEGLNKLKNVRVIVDKFGPEDLVNKEGPSQFHAPTAMSPFRQQLANAIYRGDSQEMAQAGKDFLAKAISIGQTNEQAHKLLESALASVNPLTVGGQKMTAEQQRDFMARLGSGETDQINAAVKNWSAAQSLIGTGQSVTKTERGGGIPLGRTTGRLGSRTGTRLRGRLSTRGGRLRGMRAPRLRASRQRFRGSRLRRRAKIY